MFRFFHQLTFFAVHLGFYLLPVSAFASNEEPEIQLIDVYINRWLLQLAVPAYILNERLYLPINELAQLLGLPSEINMEPAEFNFEGISGSPEFRLYRKDDFLVFHQGKEKQIWPAESWLPQALDFDLDFFIQEHFIEKLWPLRVEFNPRRLRLDLTSEASFPQLEARLRALEREIKLRYLDMRIERQQPAPGLPYAAVSPPIIDWLYSNRITENEQLADIQLRHDLLGLGHEWRLVARHQSSSEAEQPEITRFRWKSHYSAAQEGKPTPLFGHIQELELGDLRHSGIAGINSSFEGRGLKISSFPPAHSLFDTQQITGSAPENWEADLYLNQQLMAHQVIDASGTYTFDILLEQGNNQVNVHLYGPFGETRIDRFAFQLGEGFLPQGRWAASYEFIEPETSVFGVDSEERREGGIRYQHHLHLGYGLRTGLGLSGYLFYRDSDEQDITISGWSLAGQNYGWQWRWQQLLEGQDYWARMQAAYNTSNWQWQISAEEHPNWPTFQRQNEMRLRRLSIHSDHYYRGFNFPMRLGLKIDQDSFSNYEYYNITTSQRFNPAFLNLSFNQSCRYYSYEKPTSCDLEGRSVLQRNLVRLSLTAKARHEEEWEQLRLDSQLNYRLGSTLDTRLGSWARGLQARLSHRMIRDLSSDSTEQHWSSHLSWQHTFDALTAGVQAGWTTDQGFQASLQLRGQLLPNKGSYHARGARLIHPLSITAFQDQNYSGSADESSPLLEGVRFKQGNRRSQATNVMGHTWFDLSPNQPLHLDLGSIEDPYQVSGLKSFMLASRSERVVHLDWPLINTGSIEGVLLSPLGRPLAGQQLKLVVLGEDKPFASMYTGYDGFWVFEFVPPGDYEVHLATEEGTQLLSRVSLTPDNFWLTVDLGLDEPEMQIAEQTRHIQERRLGAAQEAQIALRQHFLQDFIWQNYQLLSVTEQVATLLKVDSGKVIQISQGGILPHFAGYLASVSDNRVEIHFGKRPYVVYLTVDSTGLLAQPAEYYTLQLLASSSQAEAHAMSTAYNSQLPLTYYQRQHRALPWVVVAGSYSSFREAKAAMKALPTQLFVHQPWIRRYSDIHQELKVFGQANSAIKLSEAAHTEAVSLLAQPAQSYTLQLSASSSEIATQAIVTRYSEQLPLSYYAREHPRFPWVVVMGSYANLQQARDARNNLPQSFMHYKPWIRPFSSIHQEILTHEEF